MEVLQWKCKSGEYNKLEMGKKVNHWGEYSTKLWQLAATIQINIVQEEVKSTRCTKQTVHIQPCKALPCRPQEAEIGHQVSTYTDYSRGEIVTRQAGNVCASAWMDQKLVTRN